ncbi:DinB family protein [Paracoccus sp. DMF-8]|uniref:DinB family protein n=1 Tax=Paracoccus sp. DMF-8 TaxID=3019445 RepID=UPI0023E8B4E4|nr:DinB family protein [Paracoccus sp. DMF-8]MDF3606046.1 DinB family protein [Paracoccus sp. DMF-8]
MSNAEYAQTMARYNLWQNDSLTEAAGTLSPEERQKDRGAFFGSIERTFSHLLWADRTWLGRFTDGPLPGIGIPESTGLIGDWQLYLVERRRLDLDILDWAKALTGDWFAQDLTWFSGAASRRITLPRTMAILQMFNHQTHHRGQIHAMLTAAGARPQATDIPFMPEACKAL